MWEYLCSCKSILGGEVWCVLDDCNEILSPSERRSIEGTSISSSNVECVSLSSFIAQVDLLDFPLLDRNFNWNQPFGGGFSSL